MQYDDIQKSMEMLKDANKLYQYLTRVLEVVKTAQSKSEVAEDRSKKAESTAIYGNSEISKFEKSITRTVNSLKDHMGTLEDAYERMREQATLSTHRQADNLSKCKKEIAEQVRKIDLLKTQALDQIADLARKVSNGVDGKDGQDGKDGKDGKDAKDIELALIEDSICWRYVGGEWRTLLKLPANKKGVQYVHGGITDVPSDGKHYVRYNRIWLETDVIPDKTDNEGKFLTVKQGAVAWDEVIGTPDATGKAGQILTNDGTDASWGNTVTATAADQKALIVKGVAGQSESIFDVQTSDGTSRFSVTGGGSIVGNGAYLSYYGVGNIADTANAYVSTPVTGTKISRNVADANPALIVDQVNAGSTGEIAVFKLGGNIKAFIDAWGTFCAQNIIHGWGADYGKFALGEEDGVKLSRNIADANSALVVDQVHADSTGTIISLRKSGTQVANVDGYGNIYGAQLTASCIRSDHWSTWTNSNLLKRSAQDDKPILIVQGGDALTVGDILQCRNSSDTTVAKIDKDGNLTANNFVTLTQEDYDAIETKNPDCFYFIGG